MKGIDCATPLTAAIAAKLAAAGYGFAARYLVPKNYAWKRLTRAEAESITSAGMQVVSVFETSASRPAGGAKHGYIDGASAYREALEIGQPKGSTIYFAVDYDAEPEDYDAIAAYLQAAAAQIPGFKVGVYGSFGVIEAMIGRSAAECGWQTYAWSRGRKSAVANIYQHQNHVNKGGITVDLNESYGNEGWWNTKPIVEPPKPAPPPAPTHNIVLVNGKQFSGFEVKNGRTWVDMRTFSEALGAKVEWDGETRTASIKI